MLIVIMNSWKVIIHSFHARRSQIR